MEKFSEHRRETQSLLLNMVAVIRLMYAVAEYKHWSSSVAISDSTFFEKW